MRFFSFVSALLLWFTSAICIMAHEPSATLTIPYVNIAPKIDGHLGDEVWASSPRVELAWRKKIEKQADENIRSYVRAVYDDHYLYVAFFNKMPRNQPLVANALTQDDQMVMRDDDVKVFISTRHSEGESFYQICVNARNVTYDAWRVGKEIAQLDSDGKIPDALIPIAYPFAQAPLWDAPKLKTAVREGDGNWTAEIRIAFSDLFQRGTPKGDTWGINFARHLGGRENISITWSNTETSFLDAETFGDLTFGN